MLLLVRPKHFSYNPQTAESNAFQIKVDDRTVHLKAIDEFNRFVQTLRIHGIEHIIIEDTPTPLKPDAIFPNNWFSTHRNDRLVLYPMLAENRRVERRPEIIAQLQNELGYTQILDLTGHEQEGKFLEGTGSLVFDRTNKLAFMARSSRSNLQVAERLCHELGFDLISYTAVDHSGNPLYHTNVMMSVGEEYLLWCPEIVKDESDQEMIRNYIREYEKESIEITESQMLSFAGNILQVRNREDSLCILLSSRARRSFTSEQIFQLRKHGSLLPVPIPTIEKVGGGSVRCMVAELV